VERYFAALAANDWTALPALLAPDVRRVGPYRDVYVGRDAYAAFLQETISGLSGYELRAHRTIAGGSAVAAELSETVDDGNDRLRTDEVVLFDVRNGTIAKVAVYLQSSERTPRD
jgi:ketosteroid isomerase-like protein